MAGVLGQIVSYTEQRFATLPASIVGQGVALYSLSIRAPGSSALPVPGLTYIFPISPQAVRKEPSFLNTIYDVQGPPNTQGVTRLVDMWGESPPIITLRGTTGFKHHSMDAFALTGKQSMVALQTLLTTFTTLNQQLMAQNATEFNTLELYNYWDNEFWQVVPVGPQGIDQSADRPIISTYTFRFAAIKAIQAPIPPLLVDAVVALFSAGAQQIQIANSNLTQTLAAY